MVSTTGLEKAREPCRSSSTAPICDCWSPASAGEGRRLPSDQITIRDGKGAKDRVTMVPASLKADLREHLKMVKGLVTE
jgi:hypothetical protein